MQVLSKDNAILSSNDNFQGILILSPVSRQTILLMKFYFDDVYILVW